MLKGLSERFPEKRLPKETEILGKYVIITGFRGVKIEDVTILLRNIHERIKGVYVQLFDANLIASWEHPYFAALNALRAFGTGLNISKDLALEALLYASGQHQIRKALESLGVGPGSSSVAVLIIAAEKSDADEALETVSDLLHCSVSDEVLELTNEKIRAVKELFNISELELEAASRNESLERTLVNLVIEHVALLAKHG